MKPPRSSLLSLLLTLFVVHQLAFLGLRLVLESRTSIFLSHPDWREVVVGTHRYDMLRGKRAVVTGGNTGIGKETAFAMALMGARVTITSRSAKRGEDAAREINALVARENPGGGGFVDYATMDMVSLKSVRDFASTTFDNKNERIDILVCNAGVMAIGLQYVETGDGIEETFQVNYLAHFYLIHLLLPNLSVPSSTSSSERSRVILITSSSAELAPVFVRSTTKLELEDIMPSREKIYLAPRQYGHSKVAEILFAREFPKRFPDLPVNIFAVHPGLIHTSLGAYRPDNFRNVSVIATGIAIAESLLQSFFFSSLPFLKTIPQGCATQIKVAIEDEFGAREASGSFLFDVHVDLPTKAAQDAELGRKVYDASIGLLREKGFGLE